MIQSVRGFRDLFEPESARFAALEKAARALFARYGYAELRLPTVEYEDLFHKSTGETTDIVQKEMFTFADASGRKLALRPEGTPGVVRAMLESDAHKKGGPLKYFYIGSMFRAERPQKGRYREFTQIGVEYLGNPHPAADAEAIALALQLLAAAGARGPSLVLNTLGDDDPECRPRYRAELLAFLQARRDTLCDNCKARIERNPLRALDCKGDGPRIREQAPVLKPCAPCAEHIAAVRAYLDAEGIPYRWDPHLVRGLDYYTRTAFEIQAEGLGSQDAVGGGGRYDGLVEHMGGPALPAVGWALGADRTVLAAAETAAPAGPLAYVASLAQAKGAFALLQALRRGGIPADGGLFDKSLKAQFKEADRRGARFALVVGEEEAKSGTVTVKDLRDSKQDRLPESEIVPFLRKFLEAA